MITTQTARMTSYTTTIMLLLAASASFQLSSAGIPEGRIVGGQNADFNEYPFFTSWGKSCGATLIHDDILLTAAHVSHKKSTDFEPKVVDCTIIWIMENSQSQTPSLFLFSLCIE